MAQEIECKTLSISEAGKILGLGRNKAYEAVQRGEIPSLRFGGKTVIPRKAIDKMLENAGKNSGI